MNNNLNHITLGQYLCNLRHNKKWTAKELADIIGVSAASIYGWEEDNVTPNFNTLCSLVFVLNGDIQECYNYVMNDSYMQNSIKTYLEKIKRIKK